MEQNIAYVFIITIPFISFILYLLSNGLFLISAILSIYFVAIVVYITNNKDRKETLNIVIEGERLHFRLSDDLLLSVKISDEKSLHELITKTVTREMASLKDIVNRIDFINFKDDRLQQKLNSLIERG